jgi:LCP family protein required for cell wall assembly
VTDYQQRPPDKSEQPSPPPESKPPVRKFQQYDYSRSQSQGGSHWYGLPGLSSPLEQRERPAEPRPQRSQRRTQSTARPRSAKSGPSVADRISRVRQRVQSRIKRQQSGLPDNWAIGVIGVAMLGMVLLMGFIVVSLLNESEDPAAAGNAQIEPTSAIYSQDGEAVGGALEGGNSLVIEPWDGKERFTILLMGLDDRPGEEGLCRTDTMMVVSIDPRSNRIGVLNIPRETYVEIPEQGLHQINLTCTIGNLDTPGGGPKLAMQAIQYNFGIRVNTYMLVNFNAFISLIDHIGGVDVLVEETIDDPLYPDMNFGYDHFYIEAGQHHLDGATALKYARSRHTSDDIDRNYRQQKLLYAIRDRVINFDMVDELMIQAPSIWSDLENGIETELELQEIIQIALYAAEVPRQNITTQVIDYNYTKPYRLENDDVVQVPRREALAPLMLQVFGEGYNR